MRWKRLRLGRDEGSTAVEAAIVLPLFFTLTFGIVEFGMALWQWNTMQLAVLDAGRFAMVNNGMITPVIAEHKMQTELPGASISCPLPANPAAGARYVCATTTAGAPNTMSLSANYGYKIIGLVGPFNVTAQAIVPLD
jgi:TadE-like protein